MYMGWSSGQSSAAPGNRARGLEARVAALTGYAAHQRTGLRTRQRPRSRQAAKAGRQAYGLLPVSDPPPTGPVGARTPGSCRRTGSLRG